VYEKASKNPEPKTKTSFQQTNSKSQKTAQPTRSESYTSESVVKEGKEKSPRNWALLWLDKKDKGRGKKAAAQRSHETGAQESARRLRPGFKLLNQGQGRNRTTQKA